MALSWMSAGPVYALNDALIEIRPDHAVGPAYNFWSVRNFTSHDGFTRPEFVRLLAEEKPYMREVNCVRLMGGRSDGKNAFFEGVGEDGRIRCDFTELHKYLRGILEAGYTPMIVLDNVPNAMSPDRKPHKYGNTYPPDDYKIYHEYVRRLVKSLVDEFGVQLAGSWRYRVGTEPDLYPGHWAGTMEEYLKLYDFAVDAVTRVIPEADIGPGNILNPTAYMGPDRPAWGLDIIDHAARGTNYFTGETGTRMTFFSCSWYDRVGPDSDYHSLTEAVRMIRARLDQYPQFRSLPVEIGEFMILHDEEGDRLWAGDVTEWSASWLAAITVQAYREEISRIHFWDTTTEGVPYPQARVLEFLEMAVGGNRLETVVRSRRMPFDEVGALAVEKDGTVYLMVYNHQLERNGPKRHARVLVRKADLPEPGEWLADHWQIDSGHGVYIRQYLEDCLAHGLVPLEDSGDFDGVPARWFGEEGVRVFQENRDRYRALSDNWKLAGNIPVEEIEGNYVLDLLLPANSVRMIRLYSREAH